MTSPSEAAITGPSAPEAPEHQELLYLRQFFYQCPAGLFETDNAGIVRMVNPAAVRLLAPTVTCPSCSRCCAGWRRSWSTCSPGIRGSSGRWPPGAGC
jgi:hypothetical protein